MSEGESGGGMLGERVERSRAAVVSLWILNY